MKPINIKSISVTKGHLTATEKRHIKAMLKAGLMRAKCNRKTHYITEEGGIYTDIISEMRYMHSRRRLEREYSRKQFTVKLNKPQ